MANLFDSPPSWANTLRPHAAFLSPSPWLDSTLLPRAESQSPVDKAREASGIGIVNFLSAISTAVTLFSIQLLLFALLRNKLARIYKPRTYLVPERERTKPPPRNILALIRVIFNYDDREVIKKCGLDAYFFLRYLKTLLVIFVPICAIVLPILIPINYIDGRGHDVDPKSVNNDTRNSTPSGLDTLAWNNVNPAHTSRYTAHLVMAILVVCWVCTVFFFELRVYIKVRQDHLTSAEHRLRASATTVLVNSIPKKWLSEDALMGLFDVFPGGVRNIWLNRDLTTLLDKIAIRRSVYSRLESAETDLIKAAKKAQLKQKTAEEKKWRKQQKLKALTKEEISARNAAQDEEANRMANSGQGMYAAADGNGSLRDHDESTRVRVRTSHDVHELDTVQEETGQEQPGGFMMTSVKNPLAKVGKGIKGIATKTDHSVNDTLSRSAGFINPSHIDGQRKTPELVDASRAQDRTDDDVLPSRLSTESREAQRSHSRATSGVSENSTGPIRKPVHATAPGNTVREVGEDDDMYMPGRTRFWQFWKPPTGSYASPVPQGPKIEEQPTRRRSMWEKLSALVPFTGNKDEPLNEYPPACNPDRKADQDDGAEWQKYLKAKHRPTHRLPLFGINWMPGLPLINKKVDTIYWCRQELARLNLEIEQDQKHPERFPLMRSAFIRFNHQAAAHMACQSVVHHIPRQMAPRMNEISPRDVVWDNMALTWWQEWLRTFIVILIFSGMIFLWALPVAWTAALSQLDKIITRGPLLGDLLNNGLAITILKAISGVLPAAILGGLLAIVPGIFRLLAQFMGAKTGAQKSEFVQVFYFIFLFFQVFLIVSIASFFASSLNNFIGNLAKLQSVGAVLDLLANNLPASANYFFSYMALQALATSSGTLFQLSALVMWFIIAPLFDSTARSKWSRNTSLAQIQWGSFFPVYTNFACIGLVYCVIAPLISIFAIVTFSLLWLAQRYAMLYVNRFEVDTGGVLYPRAINQTFTGIYFMELCMAGLFFIVQDTNKNRTCTPHGIVMIIVFLLTVGYQIILNLSFSPLFRYLPVTFEDEAVLRDEAFQRAQDARFSQSDQDRQYDDEAAKDTGLGEYDYCPSAETKDIGSDKNELYAPRQGHHLREHVKQVGAWAKDSGSQIRKIKAKTDNSKAVQYRRKQRRRDLEAQKAMGDALYGGYHDEIEDLTPGERDMLTRHAFLHYALRVRRPVVWIPRDDLGISDDEIRRTRDYSEFIWMSNEGTALDSKMRVVYGQNPPDFSEDDIINL
ncbi:hypothetical protein CDD82_5826 [Ophiocordyceps australis]|uniref:CSC1/OSCA1-like 7TM region domain-containing protein n=1 Tax=Ophiocordyceps australis TaxID=1399860 RepID=A0A2C5ZRM9_9HYPO|nr:hypothetical protein CDD82_5826 [Ophiocordyceps australis]